MSASQRRSSSLLTDTLRSLLKIHPGEGVRVGVMILYSAAAVGGVLTVGQAASVALFMSRLPPSATPFAFILPAFSVIPTLLLYNRVAPRFQLHQMIIGSNALLLAVTLMFRVLLATPYGTGFAVLAALFLFNEVSFTLVILQFWTVAGQIFNPREARRLFGSIAVGGTLSNIAAGFFLGKLVKLIGVENLLLIVSLSLAVCIVCVWTLAHIQRLSPERSTTALAVPHRPATPTPTRSLGQDLSAMRRSPLLLAMGGLTILLSLLINIGAYQYYLVLQVVYTGRGEELAAFLGAFEFWSGLAALFVQVYLTSRVMSRLGVFAALLFFPLGMMLGAVSGLLTGGALWAMALIRAADPAFRRTINTSALNVLYLPVPSNMRLRAAQLVESLYALSFGILGVVFLLLQKLPAWTHVHWSFPVLGLAAAWVALLGPLRQQYTRALAENLKKRTLDFEGETIDISDDTTAGVLANALGHADELYVVHALQLISAAPKLNWDRHVAALLAHFSPAVRSLALQHLGRPGNSAYAEQISGLLAASEPEVRAAAIEAFCTVAGQSAVAHILPMLTENSPRVKGAVIIGAVNYGGLEGKLHVTARLKDMLGSGDPAMRREGARLIGVVQLPTFYESLIPLLGDTDRDVQQVAIHAAGALRRPELVLHLIRRLGEKATASAAVEALVQSGSEVEPLLETCLRDPANGRMVRAQVPRILQSLGSRRALGILLAHLREPDDIVRGAVYRALARLQAGAADPSARQGPLRDALQAELRDCYALYVARADLNVQGEDPLLNEALGLRLGQALDRVFFLLDSLHPDQAQRLARVRRALNSEQGGVRPVAIELLDTLRLAVREVKELLIPLLEAPAEEVLNIARQRFTFPRRPLADRLAELAQDPDPWLRACALFRIGTLNLRELTNPVRVALECDDSLVCETALLACRKILPPEQVAPLLTAQADADRFPSVTRSARAWLQELEAA